MPRATNEPPVVWNYTFAAGLGQSITFCCEANGFADLSFPGSNSPCEKLSHCSIYTLACPRSVGQTSHLLSPFSRKKHVALRLNISQDLNDKAGKYVSLNWDRGCASGWCFNGTHL
jgi:hypothetical protein